MDESKSRWGLDPEIESSYEAIGRSVVEAAMAQAQTGGGEGNDFDATVNVRLTLGASGAGERMPVVCCICTIEGPGSDTIIICRGPCCPGF